jgi:hypothetical protein
MNPSLSGSPRAIDGPAKKRATLCSTIARINRTLLSIVLGIYCTIILKGIAKTIYTAKNKPISDYFNLKSCDNRGARIGSSKQKAKLQMNVTIAAKKNLFCVTREQ